MYAITGTRSETASCLLHTPRMYTCAHLKSVSQQWEGLWFPKVTRSLLKLNECVEIYYKRLAGCKVCAWLETCLSPKQSCWLPPHPHPGTSTIIFTAGNSKVVWSFWGWNLSTEITLCDTISNLAKCTRSPWDQRSSSSGRHACLICRSTRDRWSKHVVQPTGGVTLTDNGSQFVESIRSYQKNYTSFLKVQSNPLRDAF